MSMMQLIVQTLLVAQILVPLWTMFFIRVEPLVGGVFGGVIAMASVYGLLALIDNLIKNKFPQFWRDNMNWSQDGRAKH